MPTYNFRDTNTGEEFEKSMKISEREQYLNENPHLETFITVAPALHSGLGLGFRKTDDGFNSLMKQIKKNNPRSAINTR